MTLYSIIVYFTYSTLNFAVASPPPFGEDGTHFFGVTDGQHDHRHRVAGAKLRTAGAKLNVGAPRTVRLIYFLPNDRPYRTDVVQQMKDEIRTVQTIYAEQMEAHGYGKTTFRVEIDPQGEPMVHRVDGQHPNSHYDNNPNSDLFSEIQQAGFDNFANVYFIVLDVSSNTILGVPGVGGRKGKNGGFALVSGRFYFEVVAHELGHAFGLWHDFRDSVYIMSYGLRWNRLSPCAAEFLSVHPYFNPDTPIEEEQPPTIELISPRRYPAGSTSVPVRVQVSDSDGLHQVLLHAVTALQLCRRLTGEKDALVEFDYDGDFGLEGFTSLSSSVTHRIRVEIVDTDGNVSEVLFTLTESLPYHIASLAEHTSVVFSVAFSPDGALLASGTEDKVKLWDVATQQAIATLPHQGIVRSVAFSPDGALLASGTEDKVKLWDVATQQAIATLPHQGLAVAFSPDGALLASGTDGEVKLWDVATQQAIATLPHQGLAVAFSPDGALLASGTDGKVKLWDVATQQAIATLPHQGIVISVAFSPDGTLASGTKGKVKLWDVATQQAIATLPHQGIVRSVAFSPDGTLASGTSRGRVQLWDVTTGVNFATLPHQGIVRSVAFSLDGMTLASTGNGTIELWEMSGVTHLRVEALTEVTIPDKNLRTAIAEAIGVPPSASILRGHLEQLTYLSGGNANISDLTGLEGAIHLRGLYLPGNTISDISAVSGLTNLTTLRLFGNNISDISAVSGLTNLRDLSLGDNTISDISAVSGLTHLRDLSLGDNTISDISAVSGLTHLTILWLSNNQISDISAVSGLTHLTRLWLGDNTISDISAVSGLTNLRDLSLGGNPISDISAVSGLTHLRDLNLWYNTISDISAVSGLTNLTDLSLGYNTISDISAVSGLTHLTVLYLQGNSVSDISALVTNTGLGSGDTVDVRDNPLSYASITTHIPTLQSRGVTVAFDNRIPATPLIVSGDDQQGPPGVALKRPFVVEVRDGTGTSFEGVPVSFTVTVGGGVVHPETVLTDKNGRAESTLTLGPNPGINTVSVFVDGIEGAVTFNAIGGIEFTLSVPAGISLIHVPLTVYAVDGVRQTIESVSDLYDALGGGATVSVLITYDTQTERWVSYFGPRDRGTPSDKALTDDTGIIAVMKAPVSVQFTGGALGTNGRSSIPLHLGTNLVGVPLRDSRITRVSDLFALDGIRDNVSVIIVSNDGRFQVVARPGDDGDIPLLGGRAFILTAQKAATVTIEGGGWSTPH